MSPPSQYYHHEGGAVCLPSGCDLFPVWDHSLPFTLLLIQLSFCADSIICNFFCDLVALLKLSCILFKHCPQWAGHVHCRGGGYYSVFICILVSYGYIGATILRIPSTMDICKSLYPCGSHLSVVSLYCGSMFGQYLFPTLSSFIDKEIIVALMYTVVTPMLNPFIYSLRNRDIKEAFEKLFSRATFFLPWHPACT